MLTPQEELQAQVLRMYGRRSDTLKPIGQTFVEAAREAAEKSIDRKMAEVDADVFELLSYSKRV